MREITSLYSGTANYIANCTAAAHTETAGVSFRTSGMESVSSSSEDAGLNAAVYASVLVSKRFGISSSEANIARRNSTARQTANIRRRELRRRECRSRRVLFAAAALILAALICYGANTLIVHAIHAVRSAGTVSSVQAMDADLHDAAAEQSTAADALQRYYTDIIVRPNDTLWDIAQRYITVRDQSIYAYMNEIMQLNGLTSEYLSYGQHLTIPYYR